MKPNLGKGYNRMGDTLIHVINFVSYLIVMYTLLIMEVLEKPVDTTPVETSKNIQESARLLYEQNVEDFTFAFSYLLSDSSIFSSSNTNYNFSELTGKSLIASLEKISGVNTDFIQTYALEIIRQAATFYTHFIRPNEIERSRNDDLYVNRGFILKADSCKKQIIKALEEVDKVIKAEMLYCEQELVPTVGSELEIPKFFFYNAGEYIRLKQPTHIQERYEDLIKAEPYHWVSPYSALLHGIGIRTYGDDGAHEIVSPPFYSPVGIMRFQSNICHITESMIYWKMGYSHPLTEENHVELPLHLNYGIDLVVIENEKYIKLEDNDALSILFSSFSSIERIEGGRYYGVGKGLIRLTPEGGDDTMQKTAKDGLDRLEIRVHEYTDKNLGITVRVGQNIVAAYENYYNKKAGLALSTQQSDLAVLWQQLKYDIIKQCYIPAEDYENKDMSDQLSAILNFLESDTSQNQPMRAQKEIVLYKLRALALEYTNDIDANIIFAHNKE